MKRAALLSPVLLALILIMSGQVSAQAGLAVDVVKTATYQVITRINAENEQLQSNPTHIYNLMDELVVPHFDFHTMARAVLGSVWQNATIDQQNAFLAEFKALLIDTYASNLTQYSNNKIIYHPDETRPESRFVLVRTEVLGAVNNNPLPIYYRMHQVDGKWKVVDVAVDNVSLVSTYRGSFKSEINKGGLDSLISKLAEKNKRN